MRSINLDDSIKNLQKLSDVSFPEIDLRGGHFEDFKEQPIDAQQIISALTMMAQSEGNI